MTLQRLNFGTGGNNDGEVLRTAFPKLDANDAYLDYRLAVLESGGVVGSSALSVTVYGATGDGATDDLAAILQTLSVLDAAGGGRLIFPRGSYLVSASIQATLANDVEFYFEPGAYVVADAGLDVPLFNLTAAVTGSGSVKFTNPGIDALLATYVGGAQSCTGIALTGFKNVVSIGGDFIGGTAYNSNNGDSGITTVTCTHVWIAGARFYGWSDAGVYPGGGNTTPGESDDGGTVIIEGCSFAHCNAVVTAKRELTSITFNGNYAEYCSVGFATSWIVSPSEVPPARSAVLGNNKFRRMRGQSIDIRGGTKAHLVGNDIEDWGYESDGTTPVAGTPRAINIKSASCTGYGNTVSLKDWTATSHVGLWVENDTTPGTPVTAEKNVFRGTTFRNLFRGVTENGSTGANVYFDCRYENTGSISSTLNTSSVLTYTTDASSNLSLQLNGTAYTIPRGPASTTDDTIPRFDGTTGNLQTSTVSVADSGLLTATRTSGATALEARYSSATTTVGVGTNANVRNTNSTNGNAEGFSATNAGGGFVGALEFVNVNHNASGSATGTARLALNNAGSITAVYDFQLTHLAGPAFVPTSSTVPTNGMYLPGANTLGWAINSAAELELTATALSPAVSDGLAFGSATKMIADIFLASGAVINWNNGTTTITEVASGILQLAGASNPALRISEGAASSSYISLEDTSATQMKLEKHSASGAATMDFNPRPADGSSAGQFRFFRETSTSGSVSFDIFKGDGTSTQNAKIGGNVDSYVCANNGNFGVGTASPSGAKLDVNGDSIRVRTAKTPSSASDTGTQGQVAWDSSYMYVCTATNTWRRVAHATW